MSNETEAYVWEKQYRALVDVLTNGRDATINGKNVARKDEQEA